MVQAIYMERNMNTLDCLKVQLVGFQGGAAESLLTAATFPTAASGAIGSIQAITPCLVYSTEAILKGLEPQEEEGPSPIDDRRMLASPHGTGSGNVQRELKG